MIRVAPIIILVALLCACISIGGCTGTDNDETGIGSGGVDGDVDGAENEIIPECEVETEISAGKHTIAIEHDGMEREYIVFVPEGYDGSAPAPLILNMHGFSSSAQQQVLFSDMNSTADEKVFIVAYPKGFENSWNAGSCCGESVSQNIDDVGFLKAVVSDISSKLCINTRRVYATGMSNGGFISHRLACEAGDVFAAAAPVAGALGITDCNPSRPMPIIHYHGTVDSLVSYSDAETSIEEWAQMNGCTGAPVRTEYGASYCDTYENCEDGVKVELCTLDPMGHDWPGGPITYECSNDDIIANEHMWEFFTEFVLP